MSVTTAPSEALTPMNKAAAAPARKPPSGTGTPASSDFAQLLRLQAQSDDAAPPEPSANQPARTKQGEEAAVDEDKPESSDEAEADKSKLPKKLQLGAEDLAAEVRPTVAASTPALVSERARDLAARLGAQARTQRSSAAEAARPDAAEDLLKPDSALRFGDALVGASVGEAAAPLRPIDLPERPLAQPVLAEPLTVALPQPEPSANVNANPLPVDTPAPLPVLTQASLEQTPGTPAFTAALGAQLNVWVSEGVEMAQLELNPRDLGPIEVRIALRDGQARIELGADVSSTRDALAQALPALAEALGDVGVQLAGSGLSDQAASQRQAQQEPGRQPSAALAALAQAFGRADGAAAEGFERPAAHGRPRSLVDLVA